MAKTKRTEAQEAKRFGVILGIGGALIGGWLLYRERLTGAYVAWSVAGAALVGSLLIAPLWLRFFRVWMKLAEGLSFVMTRVILCTFFFLILTPIGLLMRILGKTPLDLAWKDGRASYWIDKPESEQTIERYRNTY
jgi:uncharacterized membrane protein YeaQ/YmgE (transglycosylase-associated protein family)